MPLKIQNYGEWEGDRPGYHPPACTCYECNEGRRRQKAAAAIRQAEESIRQPAAPFPTAKEITRRPATPVSSTKKSIQRPTPPPVSPTPIHRDLPRRTRAKTPPTHHKQRRGNRVFRVSRTAITTALRYTLALHTVTLAALVIYTVIQGGTSDVPPMLTSAGKAYAGAWVSGVDAILR